jgi:hypothetical protein
MCLCSRAQHSLDGAALSVDLPAAPAVSGEGHATNVPQADSHTLPVESTLLLFGASICQPARPLCSTGCCQKDTYSTLSRSLHPATPATPQDDLVAALDAVLALASDLVSSGPSWQQAKAHHPLALIDALYDTSLVRGRPCLLHA